MSEKDKMIEHIKARKFSEAMIVHDEWADRDVRGCTMGLFEIEKSVGKSVFEEYEEFLLENME